MASPSEPKTLPQTFGAAAPYVWAPILLMLIGVLGASDIGQHQPQAAVLVWALTGLYLLVAAVMLSLRIRVDTDGLTQRWLFSSTRIAWNQIARLDRTRRGYALLDKDNREVVLLRFLPPAAQQTIAAEAMARARLRKVAGTPKPPLLEQWERKK